MNLHEYQAKALFRKFGVGVPRSSVAESTQAARALQKQNANRADIAQVIEQLNRIERVSTETRDLLKSDTEPETDVKKLEKTLPKPTQPKITTPTDE